MTPVINGLTKTLQFTLVFDQNYCYLDKIYELNQMTQNTRRD